MDSGSLFAPFCDSVTHRSKEMIRIFIVWTFAHPCSNQIFRMFVVFSCVRELQYHELKISHERASWPWLCLYANILVSIYISQSCSLQISLPLWWTPCCHPPNDTIVTTAEDGTLQFFAPSWSLQCCCLLWREPTLSGSGLVRFIWCCGDWGWQKGSRIPTGKFYNRSNSRIFI